MPDFKPPKSVTQAAITAKDTALKLFKAIVLEMNRRGKTIEQIKEFAKNPGPESLNLVPDNYSSRDALFHQIKLNSNLEERVVILMELEETKQL
jgi:hypothetical protein